MFYSHNADDLNKMLGGRTGAEAQSDAIAPLRASAPLVPPPTAKVVSLVPKQVIFNPPATIVYWQDGDKTVVRCNNEEFSEESGFAMACMRKIYGTRANFKAQFKNAYRPQEKKSAVKKNDAVSVENQQSGKRDTVNVRKNSSKVPSLDMLLKELAGDDSMEVGIAFRVKGD